MTTPPRQSVGCEELAPGPFRQGWDDETGKWSIYDRKYNVIAEMKWPGGSPEADLFTASHDLFAACEELIACRDLKTRIEGALNDRGPTATDFPEVLAEYVRRKPLAWAALRTAVAKARGMG